MNIEDIVHVFIMKAEKELAWHMRYHTHIETNLKYTIFRRERDFS